MKKITVIGSSNTDMVIKSQTLPRPGQTVLGGSFMMNAGGKGANQAVAAARLGGDVAFVCKIGNDIFGAETLKNLKNENIHTTHVTIADGVASGVALINVDAKAENCIAVAPGANACLLPADIDAARDAICASAVVVMQLETPVETITHAARLAHEAGVTVVLNPAPAPAKPLPAELLANVDIIVPNVTETELLTGIAIEDAATGAVDRPALLRAIEALHAMGPRAVVITMGSHGAIACEAGEGEPYHVPAMKVQAVDTTAAGDTFCGALCVSLTEGHTLREAVEFGCRASAISVTRMGAQCSVPYRSEL